MTQASGGAGGPEAQPSGAGRASGGAGQAEASVRVERPGALTTVQDAGRPGLAHLGVPRSGALDPAARRLANRLAGNPADAPVLETTLTGVALRFLGAATAAVTGAVAPVRLDGEPVSRGEPVQVGAGQLLDVGRARDGVRSYVAVCGGFAVPQVLGSASTDLLSGLGPAPLTVGQLLAVGAVPGTAAAAPEPARPAPGPGSAAGGGSLGLYVPSAGPVELPIHPGPRHDRLTPAGRATLAGAEFTVAIASNRIALRLHGQGVEQASRGELPSEGIVWGAMQLLPDGNLVVFLADHPTTGGYPVIAVVDQAGGSACAQAAPGAAVRFRMIGGE